MESTLHSLALGFSVVAAFYYLKIVKVMFFDEPPDRAAAGGGVALRFVLSLNALGVLALGLLNAWLVAAVTRALP